MGNDLSSFQKDPLGGEERNQHVSANECTPKYVPQAREIVLRKWHFRGIWMSLRGVSAAAQSSLQAGGSSGSLIAHPRER